MDWQINLIKLFLYINQVFKYELYVYCQRMINNSNPKFSDTEVIALIIFFFNELFY